ncbi:MAG: hypothetical protein AB8F74_14515 [Saprospiraceae bacterium]
MRILGYINHPTYMVTVFQMDDKFSIQFEKGLLVQTYKYRSGPLLNGMKELETLVTTSYLAQVEKVFLTMEQNRSEHMPRAEEEDEFEDII